MISELFEHLDYAQRQMGKLEVPDWWPEFRDDEAKKYKPGDRSWEQRQVDADCLLPEIMLQRNNWVDLPTHKGHDYILKRKKIDNKLFREWFNVTESKKNWYMKCILEGELDYFAFYKYVHDYWKPLEPRQIVEYELYDVVSAREVIKNLNPSKKYPGDWYYCVHDNRSVLV
jgi:hypothetical protein